MATPLHKYIEVTDPLLLLANRAVLLLLHPMLVVATERHTLLGWSRQVLIGSRLVTRPVLKGCIKLLQELHSFSLLTKTPFYRVLLGVQKFIQCVPIGALKLISPLKVLLKWTAVIPLLVANRAAGLLFTHTLTQGTVYLWAVARHLLSVLVQIKSRLKPVPLCRLQITLWAR